MTAQFIRAGAFSGPPAAWHQIDWSLCHRQVRRLQARIVKATRQGRWGKVKALQWLLTHSFAGKALAVRRVTENQGKRTPGVDKVLWDRPEKKWNAIDGLRRRGYRPSPLRRLYIPKANGKQRPLGIPTMKDRAMQALYLLALLPVAETRADGCSVTSFRRTKRAGKRYCPKVHLIRYADDFVITADTRQILEDRVKPLVERFLAGRGLTLSAEKTRITHISEGFDFLGQNVRKYAGKLLIKPSAENYRTCVAKIRTIIKTRKTVGQAALIKMLNPIIRGWAHFHRHVVAKRCFQTLDKDVWRALW